MNTANRELVRARVLVDGKNLADHDAAELRPVGLVALDLDAGHGEALGELPPGNRRITEAAQPALGYEHFRFAFCS
jgi:hypothetical protein